MRRLANFAGFQLVWWSSILGAANGRPWLGPIVLAALFAVHLASVSEARSEALLAASAAALGWALDAGLVAAGWLAFPGGGVPASAPFWMVGLWIGFAATLGSSLRWLRDRPWTAAAFGAVGGPLAYSAGARLGAVELASGAWAAVAAEWALAAPALGKLSKALTAGREER